jgi:hypothetical protein
MAPPPPRPHGDRENLGRPGGPGGPGRTGEPGVPRGPDAGGPRGGPPPRGDR